MSSVLFDYFHQHIIKFSYSDRKYIKSLFLLALVFNIQADDSLLDFSWFLLLLVYSQFSSQCLVLPLYWRLSMTGSG